MESELFERTLNFMYVVFNEYFHLIAVGIFLFGITLRYFLIQLSCYFQQNPLKNSSSRNNKYNKKDEQQEEQHLLDNIEEKDKKMVFVCKTDIKLKPSYISEQTAELSKGNINILYEKNK